VVLVSGDRRQRQDPSVGGAVVVLGDRRQRRGQSVGSSWMVRLVRSFEEELLVSSPYPTT
jgi:hypothetical protein